VFELDDQTLPERAETSILGLQRLIVDDSWRTLAPSRWGVGLTQRLLRVWAQSHLQPVEQVTVVGQFPQDFGSEYCLLVASGAGSLDLRGSEVDHDCADVLMLELRRRLGPAWRQSGQQCATVRRLGVGRPREFRSQHAEVVGIGRPHLGVGPVIASRSVEHVHGVTGARLP
jgi:hypothetical protein